MTTFFRLSMVSAVLWTVTTAAGADADRWPQFRGAKSDGVADSTCPIRWSETENVRWRLDVPGEGWSSPVVWGDRLFLTTAVPVSVAAGQEASRPEPYRGGGGRRRSDLTQATYQWQVICLDSQSGEVRWRRTADEGNPPIPRHSSNTYATETPVTDGERVYAYFGMTGVYCYDMNGEPLWQKDLGSYEMRAGWGTASSPVLYDGKLILQIDSEEQSFLIALDSESGEELWRTDRNEPSQYSSPIIWQNSQRDEVITGGQFCRSYDPANGSLLWELDMEKGRSSATPLAAGDRLYVGTEFRNRGGSDDGGGYLFAVKPGGSGDITPPHGSTSSDYIAWKLERSGIQMASPVLCQGYLYLLERRSGTLHCIDSEAGQLAYRTRIPGARAFWASPWTCNGKVYCLDAGGTTYVLDSGPKFEVIASNAIDEQTWSTPSIAHGKLYLRTMSSLYCIASNDRNSAEGR